jgi:hypothetical protein
MANSRRSSSFAKDSLTRRDVLKIGGALIPATMLLPPWLGANAQTVGPFDFYISTTGSDSNPGTLAEPWAITALTTKIAVYGGLGKKIGLVAGTYDLTNVNGVNLMANTPTGGLSIEDSALFIDGGSAVNGPTYVASCDSLGNYLPPKPSAPDGSKCGAILTAKGASGYYGGTSDVSTRANMLYHTNNTKYCPHQGYVVIDGIGFTGMLTAGVKLGTDFNSSNLQGMVVQNCEFFDLNATTMSPLDNTTMLECAETNGLVIQNCYFHDGVGPKGTTSDDHFSGTLFWHTAGTVIQNNTLILAGSFFAKNGGNQGADISYNYVLPRKVQGGITIMDWTGVQNPEVSITQPNNIHHNVLLGEQGCWFIPTLQPSYYSYGLTAPLNFYNNTLVIDPPAGGYTDIPSYGSHFQAWTQASAPLVSFYNNLLAGSTNNGTATLAMNAKGWATVGYNLYFSGAVLRQMLESTSNAYASGCVDFTSLTTYITSIQNAGGPANFEQGSFQTSHALADLFLLTGANADQYKLGSGSDAVGAGRVGGVSSGAVCDIGAWGDGATWIGCNFAYDGPIAPVLDEVS